jgi:hypothetical protein
MPYLPPVGLACLAKLTHRKGRESVVQVQPAAAAATAASPAEQRLDLQSKAHKTSVSLQVA